jgi:hypothetical protein
MSIGTRDDAIEAEQSTQDVDADGRYRKVVIGWRPSGAVVGSS